jgi:hypothetical protein
MQEMTDHWDQLAREAFEAACKPISAFQAARYKITSDAERRIASDAFRRLCILLTAQGMQAEYDARGNAGAVAIGAMAMEILERRGRGEKPQKVEIP